MSRVSPKAADPKIRSALIDTAARLLAQHEPLTIRRLAADVGTSTMAVYTHFGGMQDLLRQVRREGFARLASHMTVVEQTRDPVADTTSLGWAYCVNALANPNLYRAMFLEAPLDPEDAELGTATFLPVVDAVERCMAAGRFEPGDAASVALQLWTMTHGMVTVVLAALLSAEEMSQHLTAMTSNLYVGLGDSRRAVHRSIAKARQRMQQHRPSSSTPQAV